MTILFQSGFSLKRISIIERKRRGDLYARFLLTLPEVIRPLQPEAPIDDIKPGMLIHSHLDQFYAYLRMPFYRVSGATLTQVEAFRQSHEDNSSLSFGGGYRNSSMLYFSRSGEYFKERQSQLFELFRRSWKWFAPDYGYILGIEKWGEYEGINTIFHSKDDILRGFHDCWGIALSPLLINQFGGREHLLAVPNHFPGWLVEELPHGGLFFYDAYKPLMETLALEDIKVRDKLMDYVGRHWFDGKMLLPETEAITSIWEKYGEVILSNTDRGFVNSELQKDPHYLKKIKIQRLQALEAATARMTELVDHPIFNEAELLQVEEWARQHALLEGDPEDLARYYHPDIDLVGYYFGEWLRRRLEGEWLVDSEYVELPEWQIKLDDEQEPFRRRLYPVDEVRILMLVDPNRSLLEEARLIIDSMESE